MADPSEPTVLAWTRLVRAHTAALGRIERALKAADLPSLDWYDVLLELERAGPQRPKVLQARLLLAQPNLSRLIDRMVGAGVVARRAFEADRRGQIVAVTHAGRALRRRMWPVYARALQAAVGDRLGDDDAATLAALLERLTAAPD